MALIHDLIIAPPLTLIRMFLFLSPLVLLPLSFTYSLFTLPRTPTSQLSAAAPPSPWLHALNTYAYFTTTFLVFTIIALSMSFLSNLTLYVIFKITYPTPTRPHSPSNDERPHHQVANNNNNNNDDAPSTNEYRAVSTALAQILFPCTALVLVLAYCQVPTRMNDRTKMRDALALLGDVLQWNVILVLGVFTVAYEIYGKTLDPEAFSDRPRHFEERGEEEGEERGGTPRERLAERLARAARGRKGGKANRVTEADGDGVDGDGDESDRPQTRAEKRKLARSKGKAR